MWHGRALSIGCRRFIAIAAVTGAVLGGTVVPSQAAGPPPNTSIFFYSSELGGVTGTLHNGVFTQTANVSVPAPTAVALTRDTLMLYNGSTGEGTFATLKAGHLSATNTVSQLGKFFALAAGSCDSILLYNPVNGATVVVAVSGGRVTHKRTYQLPKQLSYVDASCDTVSFYRPPPLGTFAGGIVLGTLKKGAYIHTSTQKFVSQGAVIAHSSHSYLRYDPYQQRGQWGTSSGGKEKSVAATSFSFFEYVAGTADSVILYEWQSGTAAFAILTGGNYTFVGSKTISAGWQFIVGGK
jgi:hypothetical protein